MSDSLKAHSLVPIIESSLLAKGIQVSFKSDPNEIRWAWNYETSSAISVPAYAYLTRENSKTFFRFEIWIGFDSEQKLSAYISDKNAELKTLPKLAIDIMCNVMSYFCADTALLTPNLVRAIISQSFQLADQSQAELIRLQKKGEISGFTFWPQDWFMNSA